MSKYQFPFGSPLLPVSQKDASPKKAFVLGVYASAVHARWVDATGKQLVAALAVASEPDIFWTGENADQIINAIQVPTEAGKLVVPGNQNMNGPSGKTLDEKFLKPLGLDRSNTWLSDLLPESRVNEKQRRAIDKYYTPLVEKYNLPPATIKDFDKSELNSASRRQEILEELEASQADTLILLGDLPIYWFLHYHIPSYKKLSQFGTTEKSYGQEHLITINKKPYKVIPLCHPRQAGKLGTSSSVWGMLHENWVNKKLKLGEIDNAAFNKSNNLHDSTEQKILTTSQKTKNRNPTGLSIIENHQELGIKSVGRRYGGLNSKNFKEDVSSGRWKSIEYEISTVEPLNRNWMSIEEFLNAIK